VMLLSHGRYVLLGMVAALGVAAGGALAPPRAAAQPQPPTLSVEPPSGPCDAAVEVTGSGFPPTGEVHETLRLYLLQPGTADVSMEILNPASVDRDGTFSQWAPLYKRGCEAATLDSQAERPTGHLFIAVSSTSEERGVRPGERMPNIIAVAEYAYTTTTPPTPPVMVVSPSSGPCDATLEITGHDFPADTAIRLDMGTPKSDGTMGQLASLTTDSAGRFAATVSLGALGCRAATLDDHYSSQLWIFADLVERLIEPGQQGIPPILTRTPYAYTTTRVGTQATPAALPNTGGGPGDPPVALVWLAIAAALAGVGLALVVASLYRSRRLRR